MRRISYSPSQGIKLPTWRVKVNELKPGLLLVHRVVQDQGIEESAGGCVELAFRRNQQSIRLNHRGQNAGALGAGQPGLRPAPALSDHSSKEML